MYNSYLGKQFLEKKFYYYILNNILLYKNGKIEEIIFDCSRQSNIIKNIKTDEICLFFSSYVCYLSYENSCLMHVHLLICDNS